MRKQEAEGRKQKAEVRIRNEDQAGIGRTAV